jgi:hypothetical protein
LFCLAATLLVASCASVERDLQDTRASWQGATYEDVVARWGQPTRSDGKDSYTWVSEGVAYRAGGPAVGVGVFGGGVSGVGVGVGFPFGGSTSASQCERTLVFNEGRVVEQNWIGPADYCASFRR